jgi:hypothetical protein
MKVAPLLLHGNNNRAHASDVGVNAMRGADGSSNVSSRVMTPNSETKNLANGLRNKTFSSATPGSTTEIADSPDRSQLGRHEIGTDCCNRKEQLRMVIPTHNQDHVVTQCQAPRHSNTESRFCRNLPLVDSSNGAAPASFRLPKLGKRRL